ncbi:MAG TPA: DNA polymerase III subunit beta [Gaiellaceae bacterium]|jgi:DNA polymerase-3 subunit beta|nr:DNA polymerase III subunit beta [Gaiellaceae bacterium]
MDLETTVVGEQGAALDAPELEGAPVLDSGMRITCTRDELVAKLAVVARAVSTRGAVQVLSGILLSAEGGRVTLAATDMELSLRTTLDAEVDGDGSVVIPGKLLVDLARLLPDPAVTLEYRPEEGVAHVASGTASYRLNTYSAEDFPRLPAVEAQLHAIERGALLETVDRVARSASRDESRPVLTGILVRFERGRLVMVATDSYRLAVKETQLDSAAPELEAIIPARALQELSRLAGGDTVELGVHENHVVFGTGGAWLTTRRIDGQFPNYRQLLPESFEIELTLPRSEFHDVVRRASVLALRNSPLRLRFAEGELTVSAQTQDVGEARETLPVQYTGEEFVIGFNAEFLRDGIDSISGDDVRVKLINPLRPAILEDPAGDYTYLLMPIRLAG